MTIPSIIVGIAGGTGAGRSFDTMVPFIMHVTLYLHLLSSIITELWAYYFILVALLYDDMYILPIASSLIFLFEFLHDKESQH